MFWFIASILAGISAAVALVVGFKSKNWVTVGAGVGLVLLAGGLFLGSTLYRVSYGEAKVVKNIDGSIEGSEITTGFKFKAPWQSLQSYDLFSQELLYAGNTDKAPSYSGGTVSGEEVTVTVGGIGGGSLQADIDISVMTSLEPTKETVEGIQRQYKSQELFTKRVVEKTILTVIRETPSNFTAVEFRGIKRAEASELMLKSMNEKLNPLGIEVELVNIQNIRFDESVETALKDVEVANQAAEKAEADQRAKTIEAETAKIIAQGQADAKIEAARGEAEANRLINDSLTDKVLQSRLIDAYREGTVFVVPDGSSNLIQVQK